MAIYKNTIIRLHIDIGEGLIEGITDTKVYVGELVMVSQKELINITPKEDLLPILQSKRTDTVNHEMDEKPGSEGTS